MNDVLVKPAQLLVLQSTLQKWVFGNVTGNAGDKNDASSQSTIDSNVLPVIDWKGCLNLYDDNAEVVNQMISMLAKDLKETQRILAETYSKGDTKATRAELHRCLGGVVYLRLPQLEQALRAFQAAVKSVPQDPQQLENTYDVLQQAMHAFWEACENAKPGS